VPRRSRLGNNAARESAARTSAEFAVTPAAIEVPRTPAAPGLARAGRLREGRRLTMPSDETTLDMLLRGIEAQRVR